MEARLQTFFEQEYNLEKDADSSMTMELSTPQEKMVEEKILSSKDDLKYLYGHNENCGIEEEKKYGEEISSSQKEEVGKKSQVHNWSLGAIKWHMNRLGQAPHKVTRCARSYAMRWTNDAVNNTVQYANGK
ncbi:hypothetical protein HAX54_052908 [Datura stramonium]|uniref:Uncharacterized protein n=1 Tax=Datura stramonium TaxID=4076 RepID=A0ABS8WSS6_DATST|nr:hypothetical protein [Datura stramonium]